MILIAAGGGSFLTNPWDQQYSGDHCFWGHISTTTSLIDNVTLYSAIISSHYIGEILPMRSKKTIH